MKVKTIIFYEAVLNSLKHEYLVWNKREKEYENKIKEWTEELDTVRDMKACSEKMIKALEDLLKDKEIK